MKATDRNYQVCWCKNYYSLYIKQLNETPQADEAEILGRVLESMLPLVKDIQSEELFVALTLETLISNELVFAIQKEEDRINGFIYLVASSIFAEVIARKMETAPIINMIRHSFDKLVDPVSNRSVVNDYTFAQVVGSLLNEITDRNKAFELFKNVVAMKKNEDQTHLTTKVILENGQLFEHNVIILADKFEYKPQFKLLTVKGGAISQKEYRELIRMFPEVDDQSDIEFAMLRSVQGGDHGYATSFL